MGRRVSVGQAVPAPSRGVQARHTFSIQYPGARDLKYHSIGEFLIAKLKGKETEKN